MAAKRKRSPLPHKAGSSAVPDEELHEPRLRIIGGRFRGRRLEYSGDQRTRPMKDRVREAVFNLLGPRVAGKYAIDLFAGTGALGLEAISRGAQAALFLERHFPTADVIRRNARLLECENQCRIVPADTLIWASRELPHDGVPWVVFCSPPYELYVSRAADMLRLIEQLLVAAPPDSLFVVEGDQQFDFKQLPHAQAWDVRAYPPSVVGIFEQPML